MSWTRIETKGEIPEARHSASIICTGDQLILYGGTATSQAFNSVHVLDTKSWTWTKPVCTGLIPPARWGHRAHLWKGNSMVVFGGCDIDHGQLLDIRFLNLTTFEWTRPAQVSGATPPPRAYHGTALIGDLLYVFGGEPAKDATLYSFDLGNSVWHAVQRGVPFEPRKKCSMISTPDKKQLVIIGGVSLTNLQYLEDVRIYDIEKGTWNEGRKSGAQPGGRSGHTLSLVANNKIMLYGGMAGKNNYPNEIHELNLESFSWFKRRGTGSVPTPRTMHAAATISENQSVVIFGGISGVDEKTCLNDVYIYNSSNSAF